MADLQKLQSEDDFEALLESSHREPVLVLKHSLTCGISSQALGQLESFLADEAGAGLETRILEIQPCRELSNRIAERTGIRHQSPQALLFRDGEVAWNGSHWQITVKNLRAALEAARSIGV